MNFIRTHPAKIALNALFDDRDFEPAFAKSKALIRASRSSGFEGWRRCRRR